jgi:GxxExxY protein
VGLQASHRGNSVVITVSDDGRGIDCERIRRKIVAKDLVGPAEAEQLTDRELVPFIWHPGLSTAETITEISGRGVGMDIVKNRIENLSGSVDVRTSPGQGTTFTIRLPLTLAIMSSLLVRIFEEIYAIPLDHIDEIVEVRPRQIYRVQGRPTIEIRKKIVALVSLGDLFRWGGKGHPAAIAQRPATGQNGTPPENGDEADKYRVVIVQNGETTIGLLVDQLIGMQEVVLKSLGKNFRAIPGFSGASILGDGRVSLILDVDSLITLAAGRMEPRKEWDEEKTRRNHEIHEKRTDGKGGIVILFADESYRIMGACFEVYKIKGSGFLEPVYQECLEIEFDLRGIPFIPKAELALTYQDMTLKHRYEPDFVCFGQIILEIKAVSQLCDEHRAQVYNFLRSTGFRLGLLVNFCHHPLLEYERIAL